METGDEKGIRKKLIGQGGGMMDDARRGKQNKEKKHCTELVK